VPEFETTALGSRVATSVGGVLTGRGADIIVIDNPLKPEEALSQTQRQAANEWYDHTLYSRLNDKLSGAIVLIMHRLHEDDLAGHVLTQELWEVVRLPAIADEDDAHQAETIFGRQSFCRKAGEVLHAEREPPEMIEQIHRTLGEYNFAGQYQQAPSPQGGGMVKPRGFAAMGRASGRRSLTASCRAGTPPTRPSSSAILVCAQAGGSRARTFTCCTYRASVWNTRSSSA
jgi:hypothetical protein